MESNGVYHSLENDPGLSNSEFNDDGNFGESTEESLEDDLENYLTPLYVEELHAAQNSFEEEGDILEVQIEYELRADELETTYFDSEEELKKLADSKVIDLEADAKAKLDEVGKQKRKYRERARKMISVILLFGTSVIALIEVVKKAMGAANSNNNSNDKEEKQVETIYQNWLNLPEKKLWDSIAKYVDEKKLSFQLQLITMNYIKKLAKGSSLSWNTDDKYMAINQLIQAYYAEKKCGDIYRKVETLKHNGQSLPRGVKADVCQLALVNVMG